MITKFNPIDNFKGKNNPGKPITEKKRCSTCKQWKNRENDYHYCASRRDKRQNSCKPCAIANMRKQRANPQTFEYSEHVKRVESGEAKL